MKKIIEKIVQFRNPEFRFDPNLNDLALIQFVWIQFWSFFRGLKLHMKNLLEYHVVSFTS